MDSENETIEVLRAKLRVKRRKEAAKKRNKKRTVRRATKREAAQIIPSADETPSEKEENWIEAPTDEDLPPTSQQAHGRWADEVEEPIQLTFNATKQRFQNSDIEILSLNLEGEEVMAIFANDMDNNDIYLSFNPFPKALIGREGGTMVKLFDQILVVECKVENNNRALHFNLIPKVFIDKGFIGKPESAILALPATNKEATHNTEKRMQSKRAAKRK